MNTFLQIVKETIEKEGLLSQGDRVLVALSGGADSVALLKALSLLRDEWNLTLTAAHVHHGIRGAEADADCLLAKTLCESLTVPFVVHYADIPALCRETGEGEEECGRRVRYEFFQSVENVDKIATAHTLNDSAETLLLHLIRGAGLQGLRGILPKRGNVIRPLIGCTRAQVEEFCREHSLVFAKDSTNDDTHYRRNFVRHNLLPLCEQLNPSFLESVNRCTTANQKDFDYLSLVGEQLLQEAETQHGYQIRVLNNAHPAVLQYALKHLFQQESLGNVSAVMRGSLEELLKKGEGKCSLTQGVTACVFQGLLTLETEESPPPAPISVEVTGTSFEYNGRRITLESNPLEKEELSQKVCNLLTYNGPDGDKIGKCLQLGTRLPGDCITLPHRRCTKSLKKLFNELKIPHHRRHRLLVLRDEQGVLWVEGIGCDARCAPTPQTKTQVTITIQ